MSKKILEITALSKSFGEIKALDDFSLEISEGEVFGLLGPNGAGKTTLISILSGTLKGFSGKIRFCGQDLHTHGELKNRIGIVPQDMAFYEDLSAWDNLLFWGGLYSIPGSELRTRARKLLDAVELSNRSRERVKNFSGGMKRRLNLAIGLIHQPDLLLLDEPTVGIDVQAKVRILDIIRQANLQGTAIIYTTHQLTEAEELCHKVAIMDKGKIHASGTLSELIHLVGEKEILEISGSFSAVFAREALADTRTADILSVADNSIVMALNSSAAIPPVLELLFKNRVSVSDIKIKSPNLETVFLKMTGRSLRD